MKDIGYVLIGTIVILGMIFAATADAATDVRVTATPAPIATNILGIKNMGGWTIGVVNYESRPVPISAEMILAALPRLHRLDPVITEYVMDVANYHSWFSRGSRLIDYATIPIVAFMGGNIIAATAREVAEVAIGLKLVDKYGKDLKARQPDLKKYGDNLPDGQIELAPYGKPGFSRTFRIYSGKIKGADTMQASIYIPDSPVLPTVSQKSAELKQPDGLGREVVNYGWDTGTAAEPVLVVTAPAVTETLTDYELAVLG